MIRRIYLDLDDVLCECTVGCMQWFNVGNVESDFPTECGYSMHNALNLLTTGRDDARIFDADLFEKLPADFWFDLERTRECGALLDLAKKHAPENWYVATKPVASEACFSGKFRWAFVEDLEDRLIVTKHKHLLAAHDALLVDDSDRNVDAFRAHGGHAILFPRLWNSANDHVKQRAEYLTASFAAFGIHHQFPKNERRPLRSYYQCGA